jgi:hypothetical protein
MFGKGRKRGRRGDDKRKQAGLVRRKSTGQTFDKVESRGRHVDARRVKACVLSSLLVLLLLSLFHICNYTVLTTLSASSLIPLLLLHL